MRSRVPNVGGPDWPAEMMQPHVWTWFLAIIDWDWRDSRALDALRAAGEPPAALAPVIAAINAGVRRQLSHSAVNRANVTGADRMRVAAEISNRLGLLDVNKFNADRIAENNDEMARDVLARQKRVRRQVYEDHCDFWVLRSVNLEALEDMVRELRDYAARWPAI